MSTSTTNESQTQSTTTGQLQGPSQELVQRSMNIDLPVQQNQNHHTAPNAASKVFAITELAEKILLNADTSALHKTLPQVSKAFHETILGSINLKRDLHKAPDWTQTKMLPAPIPPKMITYQTDVARSNGTFDHENAPVIEANAQHVLSVRFDRDAIAWACGPDRSANAVFRDMLICQPPVVAVEIFCWSTVDYKPKLEQGRIENENGVTCGQLFDLVQASSPIGGNARLTWFFSDRSA